MQLNIEQIMEILPHRPPFLLVDKITDCEPGVKATGIKCVTMNEPFFVGHFPGQAHHARGTDPGGSGSDRSCGRPVSAREQGKAGHFRRREERPL